MPTAGLRDPHRLVRGVWDPSPLIVLGARAVEAAALLPGGHGRHSALLQLRSPTVVLQERKEALFVPSDRAKFGTGKIIPFWFNSEGLVSLDAEETCFSCLDSAFPSCYTNPAPFPTRFKFPLLPDSFSDSPRL